MIREGPSDRPGSAAECSPPLDVIETETGIEIVIDMPGVSPDAVHVMSARNVLMIAGEKIAPACEHREAAFHLAERSFGRFARAVRLDGAFDAGRASASFTSGELRITMPRIEERRGKEIRIPVRA